MFVKHIINQIKTIFVSNKCKPLLGRWNIDYCNKKLNKKIDLSNEDHCGPCGQYIISKTSKYHKQFETINKN